MSNVIREFLDPQRKLLDVAAEWLLGHVRQSSTGAHSLAHLLVFVPTAQSARNLRLRLAVAASSRGWGGVLPPVVAMPSQVLIADDVRVATEAEELALLSSVIAERDLVSDDRSLARAQSVLDVYSVLGERALFLREVKCEIDAERWRDLADLESRFFAALARHGLVSRAAARRQASERGCVEPGVEHIVLAGLADVSGALERYLASSPQSVHLLLHAAVSDADGFDEWGRPVRIFASPVTPDLVFPAPTALVETDDIARFFRAVSPADEMPALAVCDREMYPELEGAFQNHFSEDELTLRNPSREALSHSSLGRLLDGALQLAELRDYESFSTLVRTGDVARWACEELGCTAADIARYVGALDPLQNAHLPQKLDDVIRYSAEDAATARHADERAALAGLSALAARLSAALADPYAFVRRLFATRVLDEANPGDRELVAAVETVRSLRQACASAAIPPALRRRLFRHLLRKADYMLEPTAPNVLATLGWLEVPWCGENELVIAGFNDGCVPENVVGHPFVPDSLRRELGLMTNERRAMRDSFILAEALACRRPGQVSIHLHQIAGDKNVMKPSRILFPGVADGDLSSLALKLYSVTKGNAGAPPKALPDAWRLRLPLPPQGTVYRPRLSVTALDAYRSCPFAFFLSETFGHPADDRNQELDALCFGNLCHGALEAFARSGAADSTNHAVISAFLADEVRRRLAVFGSPLPAIVELQGEAAIERLNGFANRQAARRRDGWRIVRSELRLSCRLRDCPTLLTGTVDRIDEHEQTGELAIIDYKTWDRATADRLDSLQLPIYRTMLEASGLFEPVRTREAKALYCILAARPEDTRFDTEHVWHSGSQSAAEDEAVKLLQRLAGGVFYPPGANSRWRDDYGSLVWESPEKGIDPVWLEDQQCRH